MRCTLILLAEYISNILLDRHSGFPSRAGRHQTLSADQPLIGTGSSTAVRRPKRYPNGNDKRGFNGTGRRTAHTHTYLSIHAYVALDQQDFHRLLSVPLCLQRLACSVDLLEKGRKLSQPRILFAFVGASPSAWLAESGIAKVGDIWRIDVDLLPFTLATWRGPGRLHLAICPFLTVRTATLLLRQQIPGIPVIRQIVLMAGTASNADDDARRLIPSRHLFLSLPRPHEEDVSACHDRAIQTMLTAGGLKRRFFLKLH